MGSKEGVTGRGSGESGPAVWMFTMQRCSRALVHSLSVELLLASDVCSPGKEDIIWKEK